MAYALNRPDVLSGVGPLRVYRAINVDEVGQPYLQTPQRYVRRQPSFAQIMQADAVGRAADVAAELHLAGDGGVPKVWGEMATELVRQEIAPTAPSRLDCTFGCTDPVEAFAFITGQAKAVFAGTVPDGVSWCVTDMTGLRLSAPEEISAAGYAHEFELAREAARAYWNPQGEILRAEVLVGGPILLEPPPLGLLGVLRDLGLIDWSGPADDG